MRTILSFNYQVFRVVIFALFNRRFLRLKQPNISVWKKWFQKIINCVQDLRRVEVEGALSFTDTTGTNNTQLPDGMTSDIEAPKMHSHIYSSLIRM